MAVYRFKVSFEDFEDIYREIEVTSEQTFADFYKAILSSIKFENRGMKFPTTTKPIVMENLLLKPTKHF